MRKFILLIIAIGLLAIGGFFILQQEKKPKNPQELVIKGNIAQKKGDYKKVIQLYKEACDLNNKDGCLKIGLLYLYGKGTEKNEILAEKFLTKACKIGDGATCNIIGALFSQGLFSEQKENEYTDYSLGIKFFTKSCDKGNMKGCLILASFYLNGKGVEQNYSKAAQLFQKIYNANQDDNIYAEATYNLGVFYDDGKGVEQNRSKAVQLFEKACYASYEQGCFNAALAYMKGKGVEQDYFSAREFFSKSCEMGLSNGCAILAILYINGQGGEKDIYKGTKLLMKACDMGNETACKLLIKAREYQY